MSRARLPWYIDSPFVQVCLFVACLQSWNMSRGAATVMWHMINSSSCTGNSATCARWRFDFYTVASWACFNCDLNHHITPVRFIIKITFNKLPCSATASDDFMVQLYTNLQLKLYDINLDITGFMIPNKFHWRYIVYIF